MIKAAALWRRTLATLPVPSMSEADVRVLQEMAAVCRYWRLIISTSDASSRRRLKRLFHGK
jgi:hypothetical protein